jgi:hypothetical protein
VELEELEREVRRRAGADRPIVELTGPRLLDEIVLLPDRQTSV